MKAMRDVWGETLVALGDTNENLLVLDADLANSTKADKFAKAHPERFLQMGIAEQNFVGVAVGLATAGYIPWLSSFAVFFTHLAQLTLVSSLDLRGKRIRTWKTWQLCVPCRG